MYYCTENFVLAKVHFFHVSKINNAFTTFETVYAMPLIKSYVLNYHRQQQRVHIKSNEIFQLNVNGDEQLELCLNSGQ